MSGAGRSVAIAGMSVMAVSFVQRSGLEVLGGELGVVGAVSGGAEAGGVDVAEGDVDGFLLGVEVQLAVAASVAQAGGLDAAAGGAQVGDVVGLDPLQD